MDPGSCLHPLPHAAQGFAPLALQVLGLGVLWTTFHCSGMCGPLVAGLRLGARGGMLRPLHAALDLGLYQAGRAVVYAGMGAAAGWVGMAASAVLQRWTPMVAAAVALGFIVTAWRRLRGEGASPAAPGRLARWSGAIARRWGGRPHLRALALGAVLAFMPCMLLFWVLSLAAASGDPVHGAAITVLLVLLTVPVLLLAAVLPALVGGWRRRCAPWIGPAAMLVSAAWLLLIAGAGLGVLPHAHLRWGGYLVMFW